MAVNAGRVASNVRVHDLGGSGPALLFAHATGLHARVWAPTAAALARRHHSWAADLRGHGDSPLPDGEVIDWWDFGRDVCEVTDAMSDGARPIGVGHSMGGVALLMAEVLRPGTFELLFLYEPAVRMGREPRSAEDVAIQDMMIRGAQNRRATFPSRESALWNFAGKAPLNGFSAATLRAYVEHGFADVSGVEGDGVTLKCPPQTEAAVYAASFDHDLNDHLDAVACPVIVATGTRTTRDIRAAAALLGERLGARMIDIDGMDHFGPLQQPERFAEQLATSVALPG